jgi:hypothetical protein
MKKIGMYTCRGQVTEAESEAGTPAMINLFDGRFDTGYRVTEFYIWGANASSSSNPDVSGKLSTSNNVESGVAFFNADDSREIAWGSSAGSTDTFFNAPPGAIIDPENLIIEDLYVYARTAGSVAVNYLIVMEKYEFSNWRGALAMAKDRQGDADGI